MEKTPPTPWREKPLLGLFKFILLIIFFLFALIIYALSGSFASFPTFDHVILSPSELSYMETIGFLNFLISSDFALFLLLTFCSCLPLFLIPCLVNRKYLFSQLRCWRTWPLVLIAPILSLPFYLVLFDGSIWFSLIHSGVDPIKRIKFSLTAWLLFCLIGGILLVAGLDFQRYGINMFRLKGRWRPRSNLFIFFSGFMIVGSFSGIFLGLSQFLITNTLIFLNQGYDISSLNHLHTAVMLAGCLLSALISSGFLIMHSCNLGSMREAHWKAGLARSGRTLLFFGFSPLLPLGIIFTWLSYSGQLNLIVASDLDSQETFAKTIVLLNIEGETGTTQNYLSWFTI